jgi:N-methylhydantoinase B
VNAPEGCVLNVKRPWPVAARHTVGQMLPDVVAGCLQQAIAGGVPAEGASSLWNPQIFGGGSLVDEVEAGTDANTLPEFSTVIFHCGGAGARPQKDGLSATAFPSGVRTIPVEATESVAPVVFYRREFRDGSGGPGQFRGGLGQVIELGGAGANPLALLCNFERVRHPARGRNGGRSGGAGVVTLRSGRPIRPKGRQTVPPRDAICLQLPGGGGFGDPRERDPEHVREDVLDGLITAEEARRDYGVAVDASGAIDVAATERLRAPNKSAV